MKRKKGKVKEIGKMFFEIIKKEEIYVKRNDISIRYRVLFYVVFS